ncbi:MAG: ADP-ribosylglycohydrolase family protein [Deltaproteobacteria bacterium]
MLGSALGDAIGELAFRYPRLDLLETAVEHRVELRYTDDTAMAIGLAESILENRGIDTQHLGDTFRADYEREPWRGYAGGPPTVFSRARQEGIPYVQASKDLFGGNGSFGNGAAMRIAPLGLFFHRSQDLYAQAAASARVTHAHPAGMDGAAVQAFAVAEAAKLDPEEAIRADVLAQKLTEFARTPEIRQKMALVKNLIAEKASPEAAAEKIGRTVAVHQSMPFAIYSFLTHPHSFRRCLFCAVLNGGDRDTLGAMAGALSGSYLGLRAIPEAWREKLENREYIAQLASLLSQLHERLFS